MANVLPAWSTSRLLLLFIVHTAVPEKVHSNKGSRLATQASPSWPWYYLVGMEGSACADRFTTSEYEPAIPGLNLWASCMCWMDGYILPGTNAIILERLEILDEIYLYDPRYILLRGNIVDMTKYC